MTGFSCSRKALFSMSLTVALLCVELQPALASVAHGFDNCLNLLPLTMSLRLFQFVCAVAVEPLAAVIPV